MGSNVLKAGILIVAYVAWIVLLRLEFSSDLNDIGITLLGPIPLAVALLAVEEPRRPVNWFRTILPGIVPGLLAGLALGLGLRIGMRLVALAAGVPATFSIPGTVGLLIIGTVLGGSYGALLTVLWKSVPSSRVAPGRVGGTALALWFWYPFYLAARDDLSMLATVPLLVFASLLSCMWIGYGVLLAGLMRRRGTLPVPVSIASRAEA